MDRNNIIYKVNDVKPTGLKKRSFSMLSHYKIGLFTDFKQKSKQRGIM